jgi:hypothetical protein
MTIARTNWRSPLVLQQTGEEGERQHRERHVTMPAMPGARLAMIEPGFALGRLEAFLDRPAQTGNRGKTFIARVATYLPYQGHDAVAGRDEDMRFADG